MADNTQSISKLVAMFEKPTDCFRWMTGVGLVAAREADCRGEQQ